MTTYWIGNCAMSSDKSYKAPLEFLEEEYVADEDASSLVSFEEHYPVDIIESL